MFLAVFVIIYNQQVFLSIYIRTFRRVSLYIRTFRRVSLIPVRASLTLFRFQNQREDDPVQGHCLLLVDDGAGMLVCVSIDF